jgi:chromosome segregation ATPase
VNERIIVKNGSIGVAQVVSGTGNIAKVNQKDCNVIVKEKKGIAEDTESIKHLLDELKSELSEHKSSIDKLSSKVSIIEAELEEENPNKEKITKHLKDSLSTVHQVTGTISNLHNLLEMWLQSH